MINKLREAVRLLNEIDNNSDSLYETQSELDKKIDFWLHYIENESIPVTYAYKIIKEIKKLRQERRICKNEISLTKIFQDNEQKLCNVSNRDILMVQVEKTNKKQEEAKFNYGAYTEDELNEILGVKSNEPE